MINLNHELETKLREIGNALNSKDFSQEDIGVLSGTTGVALFNFYYCQLINESAYHEKGIEALELVVERINGGYNISSLCSGITGALWALEHLNHRNFIEFHSDEFLASFDSLISETMFLELRKKEFDFMHSSLGYAYYFLLRYDQTKRSDLKKLYKGYLSEVVASLENSAQQHSNGLRWSFNLDSHPSFKGINLSLSHGMSSILVILSKIYEQGLFQKQILKLLRGGVDYILGFEKHEPGLFSMYPAVINEALGKDENSRLAWCYGDLGIGLGFWHASKSLKDSDLRNKALQIFNYSTKRTNSEETMVIDTGICHGAFGIAQIFNYIYKETRDVHFRTSATYWIDCGLKMADQSDVCAGFNQWNGRNQKWEYKYSLLEGIAGIGLVIIDYLMDEQNHWDECLLIS